MPQLLFTAIGIQEQQAADARQHFLMTMAAIGACFAKDGQQIANKVLASLDGGPLTVEDVYQTMSDDARKVMFGQRQSEVLDGSETDSDQNTD